MLWQSSWKSCLKYAANLHKTKNHLASKYMPAENSNKERETIIFVCVAWILYLFSDLLLTDFFLLTMIFSYIKSYDLMKKDDEKTCNSPRVSHFSLALQISSLERKDLFQIITAYKRLF